MKRDYVHDRQHGMTLIEVLIAVLILGLGLLGVAGLQSRGQQHSAAAQVRTHATVLVNSLMDRMRSNRVVSDAGGYGGYSTASPPPAAANCRMTACTTSVLRSFDISQWLTQVQDTLPDGQGTIAYASVTGAAGISRYTITVSWALRETEKDDPASTIDTRKTMTWVMSP